MNYCSSAISCKIRALSFFATISVVIIHTNTLESMPMGSISWWLGNLIGYAQHWAVPFFFIVSGFFFHRQFEKTEILKFYPIFLKGKVRSLLVPYLLWGALYGTLVMTPLLVGVAWQHGDADLFSKTIFSQNNIFLIFDSFIGISHAPPNGALWYIRLLLLVFLFAPFWLLLFRWNKWIGGILGLCLILFSPLEGTYQETFSISGLVNFCFKANSLGWILLGMLISQLKIEIRKCHVSIAVSSLLLWAIATYLPLWWLSYGCIEPYSIILIHRISPILFVIFYWYFGELVVKRLPIWIQQIIPFTFWIYCMHHPITGYIRAFRHLVLGHSLASDYIGQFTGWAITLLVCLIAGVFVKKFAPTSYALLTGGRRYE